ncbi:transposase family protein [Nostoc sp.]|uniref:transposase family protein n=1 Tax=Nostoc sp. TaxID=1180 RepID=UPI003FA60F7A
MLRDKSRKAEISELHKQENRQFSSRRIGVEHMICRVKIFRVASERFRLSLHRYNLKMLVILFLWVLKLAIGV